MRSTLQKHYKIILSLTLLVGVVALIALSSFKSGTWLTGWDNLHPEFDFWLNIRRGFFSTWKSFQGLGAVSGIALSSELPHQILLWSLSTFLPRNQLRFMWTIAMLAAGSIGMFFFTKSQLTSPRTKYRQTVATLSGLFYLLNFGTVQHFYTPYESFTIQYGFFPWVALSALKFLKQPSWKNAGWVSLAAILIMPIAYVPTVFIVTMLCIGVFILEHLFRQTKKGKALLASLGFVTIFVILNLHWLGPFTYYVATQGSSTAESKINQFASIDARASNTEYGRWQDVVLLRGFWYEYLDTPAQSEPQFLMQAWRDHYGNPVIPLLGLLAFGVILLGVFALVKAKNTHRWSIIVLFLLSIFMLKSYNPPLGFLFDFLSNTVPLFGEIFRYTFTKWICTAIFAYSILFGFGGGWLITKIEHLRFKSLAQHSLRVVLVLSLVTMMFPVFRGHIFSSANQLKIPNEYFAVMKYFKTQPRYARIATFPQYSFWGWDVYTWGYRGSGWWRHGIEQPLLERTHDVWAKENEQYYNEISTALYTDNIPLFSSVVQKYQIGWLLIDHNLDYGKDKHIPQLKLFAETSQLFDVPIQLGSLTIYPRKDITQLAQTYFNAQPVLQTSESYAPYQADNVYEKYGDYIASETPNIIPLFDRSSIQNIRRSDNVVSFLQDVDVSGRSSLSIPNFFASEKTVPSSIAVKREDNTIFVKVQPELPSIQVGEQRIELIGQEKVTQFSVSQDVESVILRINQLTPSVVSSLTNEYQEVTRQYLSTQDLNRISLYNASPSAQVGLSDDFFNAPATRCAESAGEVQKELFENRTFSIQAQGTLGCVSIRQEELDTSQLSELQFDAKSTTTEKPLFIAKDPITNQILNTESIIETSFSPDWETKFTFIDPTENDQQSKLELALALDATNSQSARTISYRNILLKQYSLLGTSTLQFTTNSAQDSSSEQTVYFDESIRSIEVHVPVIQTHPAGFYNSSTRRFNDLTKNCDSKNNGTHDKKVIGSTFEYFARNASECDAWDYSQSQSHINYLLETKSQSLSGRPLQVCLSHTATNRCSVQELLAHTVQWTTQFFPVRGVSSPGNAYVLQINNLSIGKIESRNRLEYANLYPYPLDWLDSVYLSKENTQISPIQIVQSYTLNPALHIVEVHKPTQDTVISLSQTYDPGWALFFKNSSRWWDSPLTEQFGIGKRVGTQYKQNSWQNSWVISQEELRHAPERFTLLAVFWPSALQLLGWIVFVMFLTFLTAQLVISRNR